MKFSQSSFFRFIGRLVLVSYLHGVFYPVFATDQNAIATPPLKIKARYGIEISPVFAVARKTATSSRAKSTNTQPPARTPLADTLKLTFKDRSNPDAVQKHTVKLKQRQMADLMQQHRIPLPTSPDLQQLDEYSSGLAWKIGNVQVFIAWNGGVRLSPLQNPLEESTLSLGVKTFGDVLYTSPIKASVLKLGGNQVYLNGDSDIDTLQIRARSTSFEQGMTLKSRALQIFAKNLDNAATVMVEERTHLALTESLENKQDGSWTADGVTALPPSLNNEGTMTLNGIQGNMRVRSVNNEIITPPTRGAPRPSKPKLTLSNATNLTVNKMINSGVFSLDKGKVTLKTLMRNGPGSTTEILPGTDVTFKGSLINSGALKTETNTLTFQDMVEIENKATGTMSFKPAPMTNLKYLTRGLDGKVEPTLTMEATTYTNNGTIDAVPGLVIKATKLNNTDGTITSAATVAATATNLTNRRGTLSGAQGTTLTIEDQLSSNRDGILGSGGGTIVTFAKPQNRKTLGTIQGRKVQLLCSKEEESSFKEGQLSGESLVFLSGNTLLLPGIKIYTPDLQLDLYDFLIDSTSTPEITRILRHSTQNLHLTHPYQTKGRLDICQRSLYTEEAAQSAMEARFGDGELPEASHKLEILANVHATRGTRIFAPASSFRYGDNEEEELPEFVMKEGDFLAYVSSCNLEKVALAAKNMTTHAPLGHWWGHLIPDPTTDIVLTLSSLSNPHTYNSALGENILIRSKLTTNGTSIKVKERTKLTGGGLTHQGHHATQDFILDCEEDSIFRASTTKVERDFTQKGKGDLYLQRATDTNDFTNYFTPPLAPFVTSDPAVFNIYGRITQAPKSGEIVNVASIFNLHEKSGLKYQSSTFECTFYQKEYTKEDTLRSFGRTHHTASSYCLDPHPKKANYYTGDQRVFPPSAGFAQGVAIIGNNSAPTQVEGNVTTPLMLIRKDRHAFTLGSTNHYYVDPKDSFVDLMKKGFHAGNTYVTPNLRKLLDHQIQTQYFFVFHERFFPQSHREEQAFYATIADHIVVKGKVKGTETLYKKTGNQIIYTLSPEKLLERIREGCQKVLNRNYFEDQQGITYETLQQLHRNTTDYLAENQLVIPSIGRVHRLSEPSTQALTLFQQALTTEQERLTQPRKPMIYYTAATNEEGLEQLTAGLFVPPSMIQEAQGMRGSSLNIKTLFLLDKDGNYQEITRAFQGNRKAQAILQGVAPALSASLPQGTAKPALPSTQPASTPAPVTPPSTISVKKEGAPRNIVRQKTAQTTQEKHATSSTPAPVTSPSTVSVKKEGAPRNIVRQKTAQITQEKHATSSTPAPVTPPSTVSVKKEGAPRNIVRQKTAQTTQEKHATSSAKQTATVTPPEESSSMPSTSQALTLQVDSKDDKLAKELSELTALIPQPSRRVKKALQTPAEETEIDGAFTLQGESTIDNLVVITKAPIIVHGDITTKNTLLASLQNYVMVKSLVKRIGDSENYYDHVPLEARITAHEKLAILAGQDAIFEGATTESGLGTQIIALANIYNIPVRLMAQHVLHYHYGKKSGTEITQTVRNLLTSHKSGTEVMEEAGRSIQTVSAYFEAPAIDLAALYSLEFEETHNTFLHQYQITERGGGFFGGSGKTSQGHTFQKTSLPNTFKVKSLRLSTALGDVAITHPRILPLDQQNLPETTITTLQGAVKLLLGTNVYESAHQSSSKNSLWNKQSISSEKHHTFAEHEISGTVKITSKEALVQLVQGHVVPEFLRELEEHSETDVLTMFLNEVHESQSKRLQGPSAALSALIGIAVTCATSGVGAGSSLASLIGFKGSATVAGMCGTAVGSLSNQLVLGLFNNEGDLGKALKGLTDTEFVKSFAINVASSGISSSICDKLDIKTPTPEQIKERPTTKIFTQHLQHNLVRAGVTAGLNIGIGEEEVGDALLQGAKNAGINAISATLANKIGQLYGAKKVDTAGHKVLHGMLGGAVGALSSEDPLKGALSGSVAGIMAEILGEMITQNPDEYLRDAMLDDSNPDALENFLSNYNRYVGITTDIAQALTAGIAVALNLDVTTANNVANNALKNNILPMMMAGAAALAADITVTQLMRQIGMTLGAVAIATLIEDAKDGPLATLTENQWKTLIALCKAQGSYMDAAPDLDNRDEGFAAHEGQAQTLATPLPENLPTTLATPLPENLPTLEGFGTYDGIDTSILFKELQRIYILYEKPHPQEGIPYVGRASGWGDIDNPLDIRKIAEQRDRNHHMNAQGFLPAQQKLTSLNPDAIRGMEQIKIDEGGGAQSQGGTSSNKINSIRDNNPKKEQYMDAAKNEFGEQ